MVIYLLRHASAVARGTGSFPNDDRPLTDEGRKKMKKAAAGIVQCVPALDLMLTSSLQRSRDTARIVAEAYGDTSIVHETLHLLPGAQAAAFWDELRGRRSVHHLMLVGHEPGLSSLARTLLASPTLSLEFKKGGLCAIEVASLPPRRAGVLLWHLTPRQLRDMA
ncbi:MAG: histidine phosphatase family protein [Bacteroidetes bacterium]|jgi:phosphohistidine phosphatase|nr:histidine phosphatase family protein [Bacteroidota bacterium]